MWILAIVSDNEIEMSKHLTPWAARAALVNDLKIHYDDLELPAQNNDKALSQFINDNNLDYLYAIQEV